KFCKRLQSLSTHYQILFLLLFERLYQIAKLYHGFNQSINQFIEYNSLVSWIIHRYNKIQ
ncbi:MAG TPA: hypothetical protein VIJ25_10145, partial [Methylococcales bacterium]